MVEIFPSLETVNFSAAAWGMLYCSEQFANVSGSVVIRFPTGVPLDTPGVRQEHV